MLTLEQISKESPTGHLAYVELIRAAGADTGEVGSLEYGTWEIDVIKSEHSFFKITNKNRINEVAAIDRNTGVVSFYVRSNINSSFSLQKLANPFVINQIYQAFEIDMVMTDIEMERLKQINNSFGHNKKTYEPIKIDKDHFDEWLQNDCNSISHRKIVEQYINQFYGHHVRNNQLMTKGIIEWKGSAYHIISANVSEHCTTIAPLFSNEEITIPHLFYKS